MLRKFGFLLSCLILYSVTSVSQGLEHYISIADTATDPLVKLIAMDSVTSLTGGTIGMIKDFETGILRNFNFDDLLRHIPELKLLTCEIETVSFEIPMVTLPPEH